MQDMLPKLGVTL